MIFMIVIFCLSQK